MSSRDQDGASGLMELLDHVRGRTPGADGRFEEEVLRCVADLTAAHQALGRRPGSPGPARPSEAQRLAKLEASVHRALERIDEHLRQEAFMLVCNNTVEPGGVAPSERMRRELGAANAKLQEEIAERERLDQEFRRVERGLREARQLFESAFHHAPIGMAILGEDGRWLQVNDSLGRITGFHPAELWTRSLREITHPDDAEATAARLAALLAGEISSYRVEKRYLHALGHEIWVLEIASVVCDDEFGPAHVVVQVQDISDQKEAARRFEYFADHDFLSGLCNQRCFERALRRETERSARYRTPGAVILIDLDRFKEVNDVFGHRAGDVLIQRTAAVLRRRLRKTDVIARIGGDEFAVLLPEAPPGEARRVAQDLVRTLARETVLLAEGPIHVTASLGVAMLDGPTGSEALARADAAMYVAKRRGGDCFEMHGSHGCETRPDAALPAAAPPAPSAPRPPQHRLAPRSE